MNLLHLLVSTSCIDEMENLLGDDIERGIFFFLGSVLVLLYKQKKFFDMLQNSYMNY